MAKICPLLTSGGLANYGNSLSGAEIQYCKEDDCALWVEEYDNFHNVTVGHCGLLRKE